ncbi:MAG TPA: phenylacetate--CoA ligase family protein [Chloroflexota bacterium]|nr:phenylacetate--CoA ligase family protein [Chloroflexota bacterium]
MSKLPPPRPRDYWSPYVERLPREQLRALQLRRLQTLVGWAYARSPFWQRRLDAARVAPEQIRSLDDLRRLPFITKAELLENQAERPPYGDMLTAPPDVAVAYHTTSGTSGRTPLRALESPRDWDWGAQAWARSLYGFGLRPRDVVYVAFGYGSFIGFWGAHYAIQKIGATTVAGGSQSSEARLRHIVDTGATAVAATPSYAIRLAQVAAEMGIDLARDTRVELLLLAGEPGANIPATKALIQDMWGARAGDFMGMTETAGITAFECSEQSGALHINEDYFLEEFLDPRGDEPLPLGEVGERVCTAFGIGLIPIIRYRTGDLVRRVPASHCSCGRTFELYLGGIIGRADDMQIIRGVNVHPSAVEGVVRRYAELREFRIVLTRVDYVDNIAVELEAQPTVAADLAEQLRQRVARELAEAHEGLRFDVSLVAPGTLPTFELKARRLLDRR